MRVRGVSAAVRRMSRSGPGRDEPTAGIAAARLLCRLLRVEAENERPHFRGHPLTLRVAAVLGSGLAHTPLIGRAASRYETFGRARLASVGFALVDNGYPCADNRSSSRRADLTLRQVEQEGEPWHQTPSRSGIQTEPGSTGSRTRCPKSGTHGSGEDNSGWSSRLRPRAMSTDSSMCRCLSRRWTSSRPAAVQFRPSGRVRIEATRRYDWSNLRPEERGERLCPTPWSIASRPEALSTG